MSSWASPERGQEGTMCILIDTNFRDLFLRENPIHKEMAPIHKWLKKKGNRFIYPAKEYGHNKWKRRLEELRKAGKAKFIGNQDELRAAEACFKKKDLKSNPKDAHILALAKLGKVKVLCTNDGNLKDDFKNPQIMGAGWHGKIYSGAKNRDLLARVKCS